jgi:hypothetical protein
MMEGSVVAITSGLGGVAIAAIISIWLLRIDLGFGSVFTWLAAAFVGAIGLALVANLIPTWIASTQRTIVAGRAA